VAAASKKALEALHEKLANTLAAGLTDRDEDGKLNAALLSVARQFLKDNGIEVKPGATNKSVQGVVDALPFAGGEDDGEEVRFKH
jgi:uncharacterized protein YggU (UPF0235/DUF167 family)